MIKKNSDHIMSVMYIENGVEHNDKDPKFNVVDHVRRSKYKNIFAKDYSANW